MKVPVAPFLTVPDTAVSHGGWRLATPDGDSPLPSDMEHWDYRTTLELSAAVAVDRAAVAEACDMEPESVLTVLVTAHSDHTRSEQAILTVEVPRQDEFDLALHIDLPGDELGGRLTLNTLLVATGPIPRSPLAPAEPGSIVWRTRHSTQLQGTGAQFPTDASDFTITRPQAAAAGWELGVDLTDLDASFVSAARLTLNSSLPAVQRLMGGSRDKATEQFRRTLHWDVTRQLAILALESDGVIGAEVDVDATSVEGVLRNVLARVWPTVSPVTLRGWWIDDRARIETALQHHCGLVGP